MATKPNTAKKTAAPRKQRAIVQKVAHVAQVDLTRRDGKANLFEAVLDLTLGTVQIRQTTAPITLKGAKEVSEGIADIRQFLDQIEEYIANAPASVLVFDDEEEETA